MAMEKQTVQKKKKGNKQPGAKVATAVATDTPSVSFDKLPDHETTRPLRQAQLLQLQQRHGNHHVQRQLQQSQNNQQQTQQPTTAILETPPIQTPSVQRGLWGSIKKLGKKIGRGIKKGAKAVWGGIKKGAGFVKKALSRAWTGVKWVGRQLWSKVKGIFHRVVGWVKKLPARLGRLIKHLWAGVKSLKPWSLDWWKSLGQASTWGDFLKWLGTSGIYILEVAGIGEVYETVTDFLKFNTRALTGEEISKAKKVFGSAIDYNLVRVDEHALLGPSWTDREYVSFNTINGWGTLDDHTFIHELTHVWQYTQMGAIYMPKAIHAQKGEGYEYGGMAELRRRQQAKRPFTSFNLEQQGQVLGDYYIDKMNGGLSEADLQTYEYFVQQVKR